MLRILAMSVGLASVARAGVPLSHQPANYSVDLDKPAVERWEDVLGDVLGRLGTKPFFSYYTAVLDGLRQEHAESFAFYKAHLADWQDAYTRNWPDAYAEIRGLSEMLLVHSTSQEEKEVFQLESVFLVHLHMQLDNIGAAFGGECTSVLARRPAGELMHFRNWDFGPLPNVLGQLSVVVDFYFSTSGQEGFRCLLALSHIDKWTTCMKPGRFSMSLNARHFGRDHEKGRSAAKELELLQTGHLPRVALLRKVMRSASYDEALTVAVSARMLTSLYLILAGPGSSPSEGDRGAVLTLMGNGSSADVLPMPPKGEGWFLVQANADHWLSMSDDRLSTRRRDHVKALLQALGQEATPEQLYSVLQNQDVFPAGSPIGNDDGRVFRPSTIASALMRPGAKAGKASWSVDVWRPGTESAGDGEITALI